MHCQAGGIGAGAIEGALAERDEPSPHERDDAKRHQPLGEGQGADENEPVRQQITQHRQDREGDQRGCKRPDDAGHQIFRAETRWNSPSGLNASTNAMTR